MQANQGIVFENITKVFPGAWRPAVSDVNLTIREGSLVVIAGPSGCGKTTLLKMVNRLFEPTQGTIRLDGIDITQMDVIELRRQTGYVIQQVGLFPHLTVSENIATVPRLLGWPRERIASRVDELLEMVKLAPQEFCRRYPAQLSGGQQQRVGLARALAAGPKVILMDEPFGAIDAITRTLLQNELLELHQKLGVTILFVTHDVNEALRLAEKIVVMKEGRVVQQGNPCELLGRPADAFIVELLNTDDRVQPLSLLRVNDIMMTPPETAYLEGDAEIEAGSTAREALSMLLDPGVSRLWVVQGQQRLGAVTIEELRTAGCR